MPFHFNVFMKCMKGISDQEKSDQDELDERIRNWIQESSLERDISVCKVRKFPAEYRESEDETERIDTYTGVLLTKTMTSSVVPSHIKPDEDPKPFNLVEQVVAMTIAPLNFTQREDFHAKLAKIVPDTMDHLCVHTQKLFASFEIPAH